MRNEEAICRINSIGCGYCSSTWSTSYCDSFSSFSSRCVFLITNTWLDRRNNNLSLGTFWIDNVFPYCWSKSTCTGIDRVSYDLLNNIIAFFEVCNLILSWNFDYCRSWWDYYRRSFMRNKTTICRIHSICGSDCSSAWSTSYCNLCSSFGSCDVFFITNTWLY